MEIDFHQCVELFVAGCQGCAERCHTGIVDEYVAATEEIDTLSYRQFDALPVGYVEPDGKRISSVHHDVIYHRCRSGLV